MHHRTLVVAGALLLTLAVPSAAQAAPALLEPLKPCYATAGTAGDPQVEGVMVRATGFTPNAKVELTIDGDAVPGGETLQTYSDGTLGAFSPVEVPAPYIRRGTRRFTLTLTEVDNPANVLTTTAKTTALRVSVRPRSATPSSRVRFSGSGFTAPRAVYAHYVRYAQDPFRVADARGRLVRTVRIKRPSGDCGRFRARRPQIPVDEPRTGYWLVQFDQSRRYATPPTTAFHQLLIHVFQRRR
jgi:hypothetical protein